MRAGLLSDPRVVALLCRDFVPCMISALNTPECMRDPRDLASLARYVDPELDDFDGGEREAFILPDGRMLEVFMSLHGTWRLNGKTHYTRAGRRSEDAVALFRQHAETALRALPAGLPADWDAIWAGTAEEVEAIAAEAPRWPVPAAGRQALRVFSRNSYRMYEELAGCELVLLDDAAVEAWTKALRQVGDRVEWQAETFRALVRAMVPRGQVGTRLADESIEGSLTMRVVAVEGGVVVGRVDGSFAMRPRSKAEVGLRPNAAQMFRSSGRLLGRFRLDAADGTLLELRAGAAEVELEWRSQREDEFAPWHAAAFEWIRGR